MIERYVITEINQATAKLTAEIWDHYGDPDEPPKRVTLSLPKANQCDWADRIAVGLQIIVKGKIRRMKLPSGAVRGMEYSYAPASKPKPEHKRMRGMRITASRTIEVNDGMKRFNMYSSQPTSEFLRALQADGIEVREWVETRGVLRVTIPGNRDEMDALDAAYKLGIQHGVKVSNGGISHD